MCSATDRILAWTSEDEEVPLDVMVVGGVGGELEDVTDYEFGEDY